MKAKQENKTIMMKESMSYQAFILWMKLKVNKKKINMKMVIIKWMM